MTPNPTQAATTTPSIGTSPYSPELPSEPSLGARIAQAVCAPFSTLASFFKNIASFLSRLCCCCSNEQFSPQMAAPTTHEIAVKREGPLSKSEIALRNQRTVEDPQAIARKLEKAARRAATVANRAEIHPSTQFSKNIRADVKAPNEQLEPSQLLEGTGTASSIGRRATQEDAHIATTITFTVNGKTIEAELTAVFDGHGGSSASKHCKEKTNSLLVKRLNQFSKDGLTDAAIWNALKLACVDLHNEYKGYAGTTANIALKIGRNLWVANVGDSRAVLVTPHGKAIPLSEDAKPADALYQRGIKKRGGKVEPVFGVHRVNGQLAVARAIGDHDIAGVNPRPKIVKHTLPQNADGYLLVQGCDGIFDVASNQAVAEATQDLNQNGVEPARELEAQEIALQLVRAAYHAQSTDNLSAIVRKF